VDVSMPTIRLIVEYDGSGFHGWQKQLNLRTVQAELERCVQIVTRSPIGPLHAAGRTDAGVHARAQVVTFRIGEVPDLYRLMHGVSHLMKGELAVLRADVVPDTFHPGKSATHKQYTYHIINRPAPAVLDKGRAWHVSHNLDLEVMRKNAAMIVGNHDFSSFRDSECTAGSPIKTVFSSELLADGADLQYRVVGSGFLKQMVRNIVGTLIGFGRGILPIPDVETLLAARDRRLAGITAPPHGLFLDWVAYDVDTLNDSTSSSNAT